MKSLLTCALFCIASCLFAQIPKGKIMSEVGLNFSFIQQRDDFNTTMIGGASTSLNTDFSLFSTNRYFFKSNVYVSLGIGYNNSQSNSRSSSNTNNVYNVSIGLGALRSIGSKFYLGADINVGVNKNEYTNTDSQGGTYSGDFKQYFSNIKPQIYYHIHPKFLVFAGFGQAEYTYSKFFTNGYTFQNRFNLNLSPRFWNYGFIFLWGKSKEKLNPN